MDVEKWSILKESFYQRSDVEQIAKELLGKILVTNFDGRLTAGRITETEAYSGRNDKACHANNGRRTARTEVMYRSGGRAYIYLCYGIHHLFNVVTNQHDQADAVLIRALEPLVGIDSMMDRRGMTKMGYPLTAGPGSLSQALGLNYNMTGTSLLEDKTMWVAEDGFTIEKEEIIKTTRIGVGYAGADALLLRRYYLKNSPWISKK